MSTKKGSIFPHTDNICAAMWQGTTPCLVCNIPSLIVYPGYLPYLKPPQLAFHPLQMDAAVEMYFISVRLSFLQHNYRYCLFLYTGDKTHQLLVCHKMRNKMKKIIYNSLCLQRNRSFGKSRGDSSLLTCSKEGASITALQIPPRCLHRLPPSEFCAFLVPPAGK